MFIRTPRLFLRPAWAEDAPAIAAAIGEYEIVKNLARAPWPYTLADAESFVAGAVTTPDEGNFLIFERTDGVPRLCGTIGFGYLMGRDRDIEIGYWLARHAWGRGIATEAGRALLHLLFIGLRLPRVAAGHFVDNPASGAVLRKLGFVATGEMLSYPCKARGHAVESVEYLLTAEQWRGEAPALMEAA